MDWILLLIACAAWVRCRRIATEFKSRRSVMIMMSSR